MTIIDRDASSIAEEHEVETSLPELELEPAPPPLRSHGRFPLSDAGRILLATLSAAAGVIHLVMVPSHMSEWAPEGVAFALAGWFQILTAVLVLTRPSRAAVRTMALVNVAFVVAWAITRTAGMPFGPESGQVHAATFVDITCVAIEAALIVAGLALLLRPTLGHDLHSSSLVAFSIVPLAVVVLATAAIESPSAANHAHGESGNVVAAGDHDHGGGSSGGPSTTVDDKGLSKVMNGEGDGGHSHTFTPVAVDAATQQALDAQLAETKVFVDKYPTVKDAMAAGYRREGPFGPGIGAHFMEGKTPGVGFQSKLDDAALAHPTLIYNGTTPDSKLAGFMYLIFSTDTVNPPEGFVGPNDHWHYHTNVCITSRPDGGVDAPLGADASTSKEICDSYNGHLITNTGYMLHVWTVPGFESSEGTFSNVNSKITCADGTYHIIPQEQIGTRLSTCQDA